MWLKFARSIYLRRTDCAAWRQVSPDIRGTTVEGRASGMGHITRALCGAGCWDHLRWRIFEFTEIVSRRWGCLIRSMPQFVRMELARSLKFITATCRLLRTVA